MRETVIREKRQLGARVCEERKEENGRLAACYVDLAQLDQDQLIAMVMNGERLQQNCLGDFRNKLGRLTFMMCF